MRNYIISCFWLGLVVSTWEINAQHDISELLKSAHTLTESGQFDSACHILNTWQDTASLNIENQFLLALTKSITAVEARRGKEARQAFAEAERLILYTPASIRLAPENQLTLAEIYFRLGRNPEGCSSLKSIARDNIAPKSEQFIRYLYLKGICYAGNEQDSVIAYCQAALDQLTGTEAGGSWLEAKIRGSLGNTLRNRDPEEALNYYLREAEILHKIFPPNHIEIAGAHYNAANVYFELLDYAHAIAEYKKAYPGFTLRYQPSDRYMRFLNEGIGDMFWEMGQKDSAVLYYDRSVIGEDPANHDKGERLNASGDSLLNKGSVDEALKYYRSALAFRKEQFGTRHPLTGACNNFIARVYQRHGNVEEAMRIYHQSLFGFSSDFVDTSLYANPGLDQINIGTEQYAIEAISAKANGFMERYTTIKNAKDINAAQDAIDLCMQLIERSRSLPVTEGSKMFWSGIAHPVYERAIAIALLKYHMTCDETYLDIAFQTCEKSKAYTLVQAMQFDAVGYRDLPANLLAREKTLKQAIAEYGGKILREEKRCNEASDKKLSSWKNQLDKLYIEYSAFLRNVRSRYPEYYSMRHSMDVISLRELQEMMNDESIVMSIFQGESLLTVFTLTHHSVSADEYTIDSTFFNGTKTILQLLRPPESMDHSVLQDWQAISHGLYSTYFAETLNRLPGRNKLIIIADGVLAYLPFEIFLPAVTSHDQRNVSFGMLENYAISYSPSATVLAHAARVEQADVSSFTGIAPDYHGDSPNDTRDAHWLKYNIAEVVNLAALFRKTRLYTGNISHDQFLDKSGSAEILHLAMHAEIDPEEPLLSCFLLSGKEGDNQKVYAYEIQSRTLQAQHAVLSACNTGIGQTRRGEGMMSLARCFQYAGCQSMVVSLWPVDDLATSELMQYYYIHLLEGLRKDVALQKAKMDYLENGDPSTRHPYYWAGFILIGNTDSLQLSVTRMLWVKIVAGAALLLFFFWLIQRFLQVRSPNVNLKGS